MSRLFYHVMQDNAGNLLFDVSGTMRLAGSGTLATIYGDEALTVILPNPMTNHPSYGSFKCFLGAGDYDFYMAKAGYTFETLTGVQGHGTMAQQDASAVAITGGSVTNLTALSVMSASTVTQIVNQLHVGTTPFGAPAKIEVFYDRNTQHAFQTLPAGDAGAYGPMVFAKSTGETIGSISQTATSVAYNTASDARLKRDVQPLTGALNVVRALRPITHLWRADDSRGYGFVAHEVQDTLPADAGVITGARDAVDEKGNILPQMIDYGKLVPWLTAALHDALGALDTLTARVASLEQQLGV